MRKQQSFATILVGKKILLREGLAKILHSANFRILASVSCADDLLPSKLQLQQPLFLVVHTGNDFDVAIEQIEILRDQYPGGRIAIVADHYRLGELVSAFRAGANGYFVDVMTCDVFIKSMELVMMGETIFPPPFLSFVLGQEGDRLGEGVLRKEKNQAILVTTQDMLTPQLSAREKSILRCLIEGDSNKCIARKIDIAEATVKVHVKAILRKIGVQNRTQAAIWGMNNGSLTRPANDSSPSSISDASQQLPKSVEIISQIGQMGAPVPLAAIEQDGNHVEVPRIDRLIRKGIIQRTPGATRTDK
ncbi:LuxR C-terminal-related transcriptional regulator [Bradyrhizobium erythrophlei]|jgi:DNA-binding NarL/FixJ family response regulator|uniref:Two component transcriptional regulator, LuxR family n=1 Tax=Bradyrhizobium erythrophlei TaxID=1437360 RepID=A0A1M5N2G9_9BRAD|nr:response regulator transcription factor [Bradyrhizobium erythrophlei]SHG83731.1 two component transcriptional regulator, LuxR family [Bradyrhizobium erythrophlei]